VEQLGLDVAAEADASGIRRDAAEQQVDQRRLAGAVAPDQADPVAVADPRREVANHRAFAEALGQSLGLDDQGAAALGLRDLDLRLTLAALQQLRPRRAQLLEAREPTLVAPAPCGD